MKTLITGFGPFDTIVNNPSARIAAHFAQEGASGHELTTRVLPVSFERAGAEIDLLLREGRFDAAILLGVAGQETCVRLEKQAFNQDSALIPDVDGATPHVLIAANAPPLYQTAFPLEPLLAALQAENLPARLSLDAGRYVCNHTYFAALHTIAEAHLPTRCLFLHVPPDSQTFGDLVVDSAMPLERQIEVVRSILHWLSKSQFLSHTSLRQAGRT